MSLAHPAILLTIPLYLLAIWICYYFIRRKSLDFSPAAFVAPRSTWRTRTVRFMKLLPVLAGVLILLALAHPQAVEEQQQILPSGINIVIALDVSGSMAAEDFQPLNRLEVAKDVIRDFIAGRPSDRIGLVTFAGKSITQSPLTLEHSTLLRTLQNVRMGDLPEGTAIGAAIMSGLNRLAVNTSRGSEGKGEKILLLITDGRNNAGEMHPLDALSIAVAQKVKIYSIGVGSFGTVPFPVMLAPGKKGYRYEKVDMDEDLLQKIADQSGGRYFRASNPKSLQLLFAQINNLEQSTPETITSRVVESKIYASFIPATLLGFCYLLLTTFIIRFP